MPSKSPKQKKFMRAAARNAEFAAEAGIDQSVAKEFFRADQRQARRKSIRKAIDKVRNRN